MKYILRIIVLPIITTLIIVRLTRLFFELMYSFMKYGGELVIFNETSVNLMWKIDRYLKLKEKE